MTVLDHKLINFLSDGSSPFIVTAMESITKFGSGEMIILSSIVVAIFLSFRKMWSSIIFLLTLTFGGIALNFLLKILFQRQRPGEMSLIEVFGYSLEISSYSFPSGHTMRSVIFFSFLIYLTYYFAKNRVTKFSLTTVFSLMILMVSFSRIIVGAHFPSDIIAAVTISISWFYFCIIALRFILKTTPYKTPCSRQPL
ncbi:phosphatase PAP2 family protein [Bacillaceae bacterium IKA-2]|nr:phosphatase PAP2 family protein [Bacillaceae bacterium IKA-2]